MAEAAVNRGKTFISNIVKVEDVATNVTGPFYVKPVTTSAAVADGLAVDLADTGRWAYFLGRPLRSRPCPAL